MRSSSVRHAAITAIMTLLFAALIAVVNANGHLAIRDGQGVERVVGLALIWRTIFDRLPPEAPALLSRGPLACGLILATIACAYVVVATLRLPE
jgi:hypothetical protein